MPGQPKRERVVAKMTEIAREESGREDATALDFVLGRLEGGAVLREIRAELQEKMGETMTLEWLRSAVVTKLAPDAKERMQAARAVGAVRHLEDALHIADSAPTDTNAQVQKARLQVETRKDLAKLFNPAFREHGSQTSLQVNFGSLLVEAHRYLEAHPELGPQPLVAEPSSPAALAAGEQPDYEIVKEGGQP